MSVLPEEPFFVSEFAMKSGGLDFLGMRQATLDLRDSCFPGFSNSTQYLRPFSLMCWVYWKLHTLAKDIGMEAISSQVAKEYREKAEVLFTWGHRLNGVSGLPGITAKQPSKTDGSENVPLTFIDWRRIPSSTGLMAAVNYGPALKTTSGFGFLNPVASELFQPMSTGVELAKGLEESMVKHGIPASLRSLSINIGSSEDAETALPGLGHSHTWRARTTYLCSVFYDGGHRDDQDGSSDLYLRSASFDLIFAALASSSGPLDVEGVRADAPAEHILPTNATARAREARKRWCTSAGSASAEASAMESLLSWIEKRILYDGDRHSADLAKAALELCLAPVPLGDYIRTYLMISLLTQSAGLSHWGSDSSTLLLFTATAQVRFDSETGSVMSTETPSS